MVFLTSYRNIHASYERFFYRRIENDAFIALKASNGWGHVLVGCGDLDWNTRNVL